MKLNTPLLFIVVCITQFASSQITGKIQDTIDNYPFEYATAALYKQNDKSLVTGVVTNVDGVFTFENVKNGDYYIEVSFVGYSTKTIENIKITGAHKSVDLGVINLVLGNQLDEVEIRAERSTIINKIDRQVFDSKNFQSSQGGNATDVIKNLPAVTVDGLGEISVRGSKGFSVLINGKPTQGDVSAILAQLPANALEKVEIKIFYRLHLSFNG